MTIHQHNNGKLFIANNGSGRVDWMTFRNLVSHLKSLHPYSLSQFEGQPVYTYETTEEELNRSIRSFFQQ